DSWRTSLPVAQQPRNPQSESIARTPYDTIVLGLVPGDEAVYRPLPFVLAGVRGGLLAGMGGETLPVIDALSWLSSSSFVSTITSCWAVASWARASVVHGSWVRSH